MKAMIKVGRWANEHKRAAAVILDRQTFYRDAEDTYQGIKDVDMVPNLSPQNLACVEIGKNFMLRHGYIKNDFDVQKWAAPEFLEQAAKELIEEQWKKKSGEKLPEGPSCGSDRRRHPRAAGRLRRCCEEPARHALLTNSTRKSTMITVRQLAIAAVSAATRFPGPCASPGRGAGHVKGCFRDSRGSYADGEAWLPSAVERRGA